MRPERNHVYGVFHTPEGHLRREPTGLARLWKIVNAMNPSGNTVNCGHSVDCVIHRLNGMNPTAVSQNIGAGGSFEEIATRWGTVWKWDHSLDEIYNHVRGGGHGTIGMVGIVWAGNTGSHIVAIGNVDGAVGICEGQDWAASQPPQVLSDIEKINARYNPSGNERHGMAIVRWGCLSRTGWESSHTDPRAVRPTVHRHQI